MMRVGSTTGRSITRPIAGDLVSHKAGLPLIDLSNYLRFERKTLSFLRLRSGAYIGRCPLQILLLRRIILV